MKNIIYLTALICGLFFSSASAEEVRTITMNTMGLEVASTPESLLKDGDIWIVDCVNNLSQSEGEIFNFLPSRISSNLRPYVKYEKVEFKDNSYKSCKLYFRITADELTNITFSIKEPKVEYPIEILSKRKDNYTYIQTYQDESGTYNNKETTIYNGLGYPSEKIKANASNDLKDMHHLITYDGALRNDAKSYLPYPGEINAELSNSERESIVQNYYSTNFNEPTYCFSEKVYEKSPLERVRKIYGPGKEWRNKKICMQYSYLSNIAGNDSLNCILLKTTESNLQNVNIEAVGNYRTSELFVTRTESEGHLVTLEFKNKFDQIVLNRQIDYKSNSKTNYDTYYIYDKFDNLVAVLPPTIADQIIIGNSYSSQTFAPLAQYAYLYKYNERNNCIAAKLPGCDWKYQIYDLSNRLVFSQNGEERKRGEWQFAIQDITGRECITGICKNTIDPFNNTLCDKRIKCAFKSTTDSYFGYSITGITLESPTILTVKYYDNYTFSEQNNFTDHLTNLQYEAKNGFGEKHTKAQGLETGSMIARLSNDNSPIKYDYSITYYDFNDRIVQLKATNHLGGYEKTYYAYNFTGNPIHIMHVHSNDKSELVDENKHIYDKMGRLLKTTKILNNQDSIISVYQYDELGNLKKTNRTDNNHVLTMAQTFDIRNQLKSIQSPFFSQTLHYIDSTDNSYSSNISKMEWRNGITEQAYEYSYDGLGRLSNAIYSETNAPLKKTGLMNK